MRRLAQAPNLAIATLWADARREQGIPAPVQRESLAAAAGQLPPDQCLPEIWVDDDSLLPRAEQLLSELRHLPQRRWQCACGELVEGGFEQCWHCGAMMPAE